MLRRTAPLVVALLLAGFVVVPAAPAQDPLFTRTVGFATKTGFRGVFTWESSQPVVGRVRYGTSPANLGSVAPLVGTTAPDVAGLAIARLALDATYYWQVEDVLTGQRSPVQTLRAANAYNDWNGSTYTIDFLVQLDAQSLPHQVPIDAALEDIAAGVNIVAERIYDALDGFARIGNVLVTDTNLDYAVNVPAYPPPVCENGTHNAADILVQTSVPLDSHTFTGWAIADPCTSVYLGRLGWLLVQAWGLDAPEDLDFGYTAAHELLHYAFNAPDVYGGGSSGNCANLDWDGSIMHNAGGWKRAQGRWMLTELDRNPELTPCDHGSQPWSWDRLRERYMNVPLRPNGPVEHIVDTLPRGNPDGEALNILILDREPGLSSLRTFMPDDSARPGD